MLDTVNVRFMFIYPTIFDDDWTWACNDGTELKFNHILLLPIPI